MSHELPTELALASDGTLYLTVENYEPEQYQGRKQFVAYALRKGELAKLGAPRVFGWVVLGQCCLACDGEIYIADESMNNGRRRVFRGFATTIEERGRIVEAFFQAAPSVVMDARLFSRRPARRA